MRSKTTLLIGLWLAMAAHACLNDSWLNQYEQDMILAYNSAVASLDTRPPTGSVAPGIGVITLVAGLVLLSGAALLWVKGNRRPSGWSLVAALLCLPIGAILLVVHLSYTVPLQLPSLAEPPKQALPLPHSIPREEGQIALRLAMVHDVIHERYPRHSPAWYEARNHLSRQQIAESQEQHGAATSEPERLAAMDDLSVALDHLGQTEDAIAVQRRKLTLVEQHPELDPYTTYANLGTHLIHHYVPQLLSGDDEARAGVEEGLAFIRQAVEVNPGAHFGRERWQMLAVEYLLAAHHDPDMLKTVDMAGMPVEIFNYYQGHLYRTRSPSRHPFHELMALGDAAPGSRRQQELRQATIEHLWLDHRGGRLEEEVPFDEPVLAVIGMWRYGGGPNPHFSLILAHAMQRVGQRYLSWYAFERAQRMADRFWPDPEIQFYLRQHCRDEQARLAAALAVSEDDLRANFEAELARGEAWQAAFQAFEEQQLASGVPLNAPDFYDAFYAEYGRIETPSPGPDQVLMQDPDADNLFYLAARVLPTLSLTLGMAGILLLGLGRRQE